MKLLLTLAAVAATAVASAQAPLNPAQPDMTGVWQRAEYRPAAKPPLLPEAAKLYAERKAARAKGDKTLDPASACLPEGIPRLMLKAEPFEVLQRPTLVAFAYQINRLSRVAYLNEPVAKEDGDYYLGESTAKWDGDTLVIDTRGFNDITWLDDTGLPHGTAMHVTERLQLAKGGQRLVNRITIDDAENYSAPWDLTVNYERSKSPRFPEDVCAEKIGGSKPRPKK